MPVTQLEDSNLFDSPQTISGVTTVPIGIGKQMAVTGPRSFGILVIEGALALLVKATTEQSMNFNLDQSYDNGATWTSISNGTYTILNPDTWEPVIIAFGAGGANGIGTPDQILIRYSTNKQVNTDPDYEISDMSTYVMLWAPQGCVTGLVE